MNPVQRIAKNMGMVGLSQIIVSIFSFIFLIYIARFFGEAQFGIYSFALSFTALFTVLSDIGMSQLIVRDIARNKEKTREYLTNVSIIKIILCFVTFGLLALTINLLNYPSDVIYIVYLFGIYSLLTSFAEMLMSIFQAFEKMEYTAIITTTERITAICLGLFILFRGFGLTELAYVYILTSSLSVIISLAIVIIKIDKPKPKIDFSLWKILILTSLPFGLNIIFGMIFFRIDTILLSILQDDIAVGVYNAAYNPLLTLGSIITGMVISAIYPVMSRYYITSKESLKKFTILSSKYMGIIGFPIAIGSFVLGEQIINLFYAGQFTSSIIAFQILALFIPIRLISSITGTFLTSTNKQGIRTFSVLLAATCNILLNLILIPYGSYVGASIATILSELLLYFILIHYINKYYGQLRIHRNYVKPLIASLIMGIIIFIFNDENLFFIILLAIIIYFTILILLKTFNEEDIRIFEQILGKNEYEK